MSYNNGVTTDIHVPTQTEPSRAQYDLHMPQQQSVTGAFLTSHRAVSGNYSPVCYDPTSFSGSTNLFEQFTNELRTRWSGGWTGKSPQLVLKEALISAAVFGGTGNDAVDYNPEAASLWSGYQDVLLAIMPRSLGFMKLKVRVPDVFVETATGDFILDEASGGLSALIEIGWQIFLRSRDQISFTVLLDEPENHLHRSLQREIMPSLLRAFPHVQFIVATHSPLVVTSTPASAIYVLDYNKSRRVESRLLNYASKAANADETLKRVLGLESTMPLWAEQQFDAIVNRYVSGSISSDNLRALRAELRANGLESEFPQAMIDVVDRADVSEIE